MALPERTVLTEPRVLLVTTEPMAHKVLPVTTELLALPERMELTAQLEQLARKVPTVRWAPKESKV